MITTLRQRPWLSALVALAVLLVVALSTTQIWLPRHVEASRSIVIQARPEVVYSLLNQFRSFRQWSPWWPLDPQAEMYITPWAQGVGAHVSWSGNERVGQGSLTIVASEAPQRIAMTAAYGKSDHARTEFLLTPQGESTHLTWRFVGDLGASRLRRVVGLLFDRWIGADLERGLVRIQQLAESQDKVELRGLDASVEEVASLPMLAVAGQVNPDERAAIKLAEAFDSLQQALSDNGLRANGPALAVTRVWDNTGWQFEAGLPLAENPGNIRLNAPVSLGQSPGGHVLRAVHSEGFATMVDTYRTALAQLHLLGYRQQGPVWETYPDGLAAAASGAGDMIIHISLAPPAWAEPQAGKTP